MPRIMICRLELTATERGAMKPRKWTTYEKPWCAVSQGAKVSLCMLPRVGILYLETHGEHGRTQGDVRLGNQRAWPNGLGVSPDIRAAGTGSSPAHWFNFLVIPDHQLFSASALLSIRQKVVCCGHMLHLVSWGLIHLAWSNYTPSCWSFVFQIPARDPIGSAC